MATSTKDYNQEITNHLEFLGYEISEIKSETGHIYTAKHPNKSNLLVRMIDNTTILTTRWGGFDNKALKSKEFFTTINSTNKNAMSKWYYEEDEDDNSITIVTEADFYDYNKATFGAFVENLEQEVSTYIQKFDTFYTGAE